MNTKPRTVRLLTDQQDQGPPWPLWTVIFLTSALVLGTAISYGLVDSDGSEVISDVTITGVPAGSTVTFYVTSKDIQHGFRIQGTNVSMMILPGEVSKLTATFDEPGEYDIVCHEYCGVNHHTMFGKIIVEE